MISTTQDAMNLIHDGLLSLNRATKYGMCVDVKYCEKMHKNLSKRLIVLENKIKDSKLGKRWKKSYPNMNVKSGDQLSTILFDKMKLPVLKLTDKGNPSTDASVLDILSKDVPDLLLISKYKKIHVVNTTFLKGFLKEQINGMLHPSFPLHKVKTYRSSSESPNFHNNPKRDKLQKKLVRKAIIPRPNHKLIGADFSGIEVRVACCVTGDKKLAYDTVHGDMHRDMAIEIFCLDEFDKNGYEKELRFASKNGFIFAQFYGDYYGNNVPVLLKLAELSVKGKFKTNSGKKLQTGVYLGEQLINNGIKSVKQFTDHIEAIEYDFWNKRYKEYGQWRKDAVKEYKKKGWMRTVTGFIIKGAMSKNEITNYPMQGPAFHCLLKSFIEMDIRQQKYKWKSRQIGQIHDEQIFDTHPKEEKEVIENLSEVMKTWLPKQWDWINIPLEVEADIHEVNESWATKPKTIIL